MIYSYVGCDNAPNSIGLVPIADDILLYFISIVLYRPIKVM